MKSSKENFIEYRERLRNALETKAPFNTHNSSIMHATEIIANGFLVSRKQVRLLSYYLDPALYGADYVKDAMRKFLKKQDTKLNILVEQDISQNHPIMALCREFKDRVIIKRVPDKLVATYSHNFMTMDNWGYRFEYNRKKLVATASFNEKSQIEVLKMLKNWFDSLDKLVEERLN